MKKKSFEFSILIVVPEAPEKSTKISLTIFTSETDGRFMRRVSLKKC